MGLEQKMWNTGEEADKEFGEFEQRKRDTQMELQQKFDALAVGETVSFLEANGKQFHGWQVKDKNPTTLEVTLHEPDASFQYDRIVPIRNIERSA